MSFSNSYYDAIKNDDDDDSSCHVQDRSTALYTIPSMCTTMNISQLSLKRLLKFIPLQGICIIYILYCIVQYILCTVL